MGKKRGRKQTRLPMMRHLAARIRYSKRLQSPPRRHKRCSCGCGSTKNLTSGWAGGNLIWQCPGAAYEASARGW